MPITMTLPHSAESLPAEARPIPWHGVFSDVNSHDEATLTEMLDIITPSTLNTIWFAGGSTDWLDAVLTICDMYNVRVWCAPRTEIDELWWDAGITSPTVPLAESIIEDLIPILEAHPSLVGWYPLDEPQSSDMEKAWMLCQAYRNLSALPVAPLLIGLDRIEEFNDLFTSDRNVFDVYSYGMRDGGGGTVVGAPEFDNHMTSFGYDSMTAEEYIASALSTVADTSKDLVLVMQAHNFFDGTGGATAELWGNRTPTAAEMQQQHDIAASFGAQELIWFRWESNLAPADGAMVGLIDNPTLLDAITAIAEGGASSPDRMATSTVTMPRLNTTTNINNGSVGSNESDGVPMPTIPYDSGNNAVITYWDSHVLNPDAYFPATTILHPPTRYTLVSGNSIITAYSNMVANYPSGGTIVLGPGSYGDWPNILGSDFSSKGNVHIICPSGSAVVNLPTRAIISAHPWCTRYHDDEPDYPGYSFTQGISSGVANDATENGVNARDLVTTDRIRNVYFQNIEFDSGGAAHAFDIMAAMGVMFDNCQFTNGSGNLGTHTGPLDGRVCLDHIYYRDCVWDGEWNWCFYHDGLHSGAIINPSIPGTFHDGGFLCLTNDDFTRDYNDNGSYSVNEKRQSQFVILYGGDSGSTVYPLQVTGRDILVDNFHALDPVDTLVWWETKASYRDIGGVSIHDEFFNCIIRDTVIDSARCLIHAQNTDWAGRDEPDMGHHQFIGVTGTYSDDIETSGSYTP